jgi:hypothetical protein
MNPEALSAWISLYAGIGVLAAMCAVFAAISTGFDLLSGSWRPATVDLHDRLLMLPRLWFHWQKAYFTGFPVILGIAIYFAHHIGFGALWNV